MVYIKIYNKQKREGKHLLNLARLAGFEPADDGNDKVKLYIISYVKYRLKY